MVKWGEVAQYMLEQYDTFWEDDFYVCPECGEPIYREDYPEIEITDDGEFICPVCEEEL